MRLLPARGERLSTASLSSRSRYNRPIRYRKSWAFGAKRRWAIHPCTGRCSQGFPKRLRHSQPADHTILMKAVGPVGAAIIGVLWAMQFVPACLGRNGGEAVLRVGVAVAGQDLVRIDGGRLVQADAEGGVAVDALQDVHVVGDGR